MECSTKCIFHMYGYPAKTEIQIWNSRDDQIARQDGMTERLRLEDWIQAVTSDLRAVREDPDKGDLAMK